MEDRSIPGETLQQIVTEQEILELTGLTRDQLDACRRERGLPFLQVGRNQRLYLEPDLMTWLKSQRVVLGPRKIGVETTLKRISPGSK
jgi:hypothetical protein